LHGISLTGCVTAIRSAGAYVDVANYRQLHCHRGINS